jgi:plasmid stabilization system protein ParE
VTEVRFHPAAADEVEDAYLFYREHDPGASRRFTAEIARALNAIAEAPGRWPTGPRSTRRFVLERYPFTVFYRLRDGVVTIIAVAHQKKRPGYWRARLA